LDIFLAVALTGETPSPGNEHFLPKEFSSIALF